MDRPPSTLRLLETALAARVGPITVWGAHEAIGGTRSASSVRSILQLLVKHGYMERGFDNIMGRRMAVYTKTDRWKPPHKGLWVTTVPDYATVSTAPAHTMFRLSNCQTPGSPSHVFCHGWQTRFGPSADENETLVCSCRCGHAGTIKLLARGGLRSPAGWDPQQLIALLAVSE